MGGLSCFNGATLSTAWKTRRRPVCTERPARFNGATLSTAWKTQTTWFGDTIVAKRFNGATLSTAWKTRYQRHALPAGTQASMGPR